MKLIDKFIHGSSLIGKEFGVFLKSFGNSLATYLLMSYLPVLLIVAIGMLLSLIRDMTYDTRRLIFNICFTAMQIVPLALSLACFDEGTKKEQGEQCSVFVFVIFGIVIAMTWLI